MLVLNQSSLFTMPLLLKCKSMSFVFISAFFLDAVLVCSYNQSHAKFLLCLWLEILDRCFGQLAVIYHLVVAEAGFPLSKKRCFGQGLNVWSNSWNFFLNVRRYLHCSRDLQARTIWQKCRCICIRSHSLWGTQIYPIFMQGIQVNHLLHLRRYVIQLRLNSELAWQYPRLHYLLVLLVVQMIEGTHAFHPKSQEEAAKMICLEGLRPPFKNKPKNYPSDVKEWVYHTL